MYGFGERGNRLLTRSSVLGLLVVLAVGLICRAMLMMQSPAFTIDVETYFPPAYRLVQDGTFTLEFKRPPVYPLFLAGIVAVWGPSFEAVVAAQHILGLVGVVLVYFLGALIFGRVAGLLAALGVALSGAVLQMEHTVGSEFLFALLLLGSLLCALLASKRLATSAGRYPGLQTGLLLLLLGVLVGLLALTRPSGQMMLALAAGGLLLTRGTWQASVLAVGLLGLGYGLVMGPWLLRNHAAHGVVTAAGGLGDSLYVRIRKYDSGFDLRDHGVPPVDARHAEIRAATFELAEQHGSASILRRELRERLQLTDAESDKALEDLALVVIQQEPLRYLGGTVEMFVRLGLDQGSENSLAQTWSRRADLRGLRDLLPQRLRRQLAAEPPPPSRQIVVQNLLEFYRDRQLGVIVGFLFVLGAVRCGRGAPGREVVVLPLVVAVHLLAHVALDGPLTRYRHMVQPLITLTAAGGLTWLASVLVRRGRQWMPSRPVGATVVPARGRQIGSTNIQRPAPPA